MEVLLVRHEDGVIVLDGCRLVSSPLLGVGVCLEQREADARSLDILRDAVHGAPEPLSSPKPRWRGCILRGGLQQKPGLVDARTAETDHLPDGKHKLSHHAVAGAGRPPLVEEDPNGDDAVDARVEDRTALGGHRDIGVRRVARAAAGCHAVVGLSATVLHVVHTVEEKGHFSKFSLVGSGIALFDAAALVPHGRQELRPEWGGDRWVREGREGRDGAAGTL
mmetsp:Transcript_2603/g.6070  ORF Transcript_2603/g.6070 Transcript_2603/m.6070 type:complete len:222 (-) Transcript_2603:21-686(-)